MHKLIFLCVVHAKAAKLMSSCKDVRETYDENACCSGTDRTYLSHQFIDASSVLEVVREQNAYAYYPDWGEYWEPVTITRFADGLSESILYQIHDRYVATVPVQQNAYVLSEVSHGVWRTNLSYNTTYESYSGYYVYESIEVHAGADGTLNGGYSLSRFSSCSDEDTDLAYICEANHRNTNGYISTFRKKEEARSFSTICRPPGVLSYVYVNASLSNNKGWRYDFDCTTRTMKAWTTSEASVDDVMHSSALAVHHMNNMENVAFPWIEPTPGELVFAKQHVTASTWPLNVFGVTSGVNAVTYPGFRVVTSTTLEMLGPPTFHSPDGDSVDAYPAQQRGTQYQRP